MKKIMITAILMVLMAGCGMTDGPTSYGTTRGGTGITDTVDHPSEMKVGDIMAIDIESSTSIDFDGVESSARFIMAVGNTSVFQSAPMVISGNLMEDINKAMNVDIDHEMDISEIEEFGADEVLSAWMRGSEIEFSTSSSAIPAFTDNYSMGKSMKASTSLSEGEEKDFYVLNSLTSVSNFKTVTATAECVHEHIAIFVDNTVSESILSDSEISELCEDANEAVGIVKGIFGDPSDINDDGVVTVLLTPQINLLGAMGGGIITGYFYAGDLYEGTGSNKQEIIYSLVPDPSGSFGGTPISKGFALDNLLRAVIPHEVQHAINYNQKVFVNGVASEESWLNEALSHLVEDLTGYNVENPSRYSSFLSNPSTTSLVAMGSPSIQERGAAYLFIRFLYEQSENGDEFLRRIVQSKSRGVTALEEAFQGKDENFDQLSEFIARWTIAMAMTERGVSSDSRYTYKERVLNMITGNYEGVTLMGEANDNRGTYLGGILLTNYGGAHRQTINPTAAKYFQISSVPEVINFEPEDGINYAILIRSE